MNPGIKTHLKSSKFVFNVILTLIGLFWSVLLVMKVCGSFSEETGIGNYGGGFCTTTFIVIERGYYGFEVFRKIENKSKK